MKTKSNLEDKVLQALTHSSLFKRSIIKTQFPWSKLFEKLASRDRARTVDIWVPSYEIAIEIQGAQHYRPVAFGGNISDAKNKYEQQVYRDRRLRDHIAEAQYMLIEIDAKTVRSSSEEELARKIDDAALHLMTQGEYCATI